jgi:hypothetical protein
MAVIEQLVQIDRIGLKRCPGHSSASPFVALRIQQNRARTAIPDAVLISEGLVAAEGRGQRLEIATCPKSAYTLPIAAASGISQRAISLSPSRPARSSVEFLLPRRGTRLTCPAVDFGGEDGLRSGHGQARKSRSWWTGTVARWRRSGLTAAEFASREGLTVSSLRFWSSLLGRGTRAEHGSSAIEPIEITVPARAIGSSVEVAVGDVVIRCEQGADVTYIAALARALAGRWAGVRVLLSISCVPGVPARRHARAPRRLVRDRQGLGLESLQRRPLRVHRQTRRPREAFGVAPCRASFSSVIREVVAPQ